MKLAASITLSVAILTAGLGERAEACSPPISGLAEDAPLVGVPTAGVVPVYVYRGAYGNFTVEVVDSDEQVVTGSYTELTDRLVWRSDAPLQPEATYTMTVSADDGFGAQTVQFTTSSAEAEPPAPGISLVEGTISDSQYVAISRCCDDEYDTCGGQYCEAAAFGYRPRMRLQFEATGLAPRYLAFTATTDGPMESTYQQLIADNPTTTVTFSDYADRYCATVTATSLIDDSSTTSEHCFDAADLQLIDRTSPTGGTCDGDLVDNEPDDGITTDDVSGCSAGSARSTAPILAALLLLLGLARRRPRRLLDRP